MKKKLFPLILCCIFCAFLFSACTSDPSELSFYKHSLTSGYEDYELNSIEPLPLPEPNVMEGFSFSMVDTVSLLPTEYRENLSADGMDMKHLEVYDGKLYILATSYGVKMFQNQILIYDMEMEAFSIYGERIAFSKDIFNLSGFTIDDSGTMYVLDTARLRITCADLEGNVIKTIDISNIADYLGGAKALTNTANPVTVNCIEVLEDGSIYLSSLGGGSTKLGAVYRVDPEGGVVSAAGNNAFGAVARSHEAGMVCFVNTQFLQQKSGVRDLSAASNNGLAAIHLVQDGELKAIQALPYVYRNVDYHDGFYYMPRRNYDEDTHTHTLAVHVYDRDFQYVGEYIACDYGVFDPDNNPFAYSLLRMSFDIDSEGNLYVGNGSVLFIGTKNG